MNDRQTYIFSEILVRFERLYNRYTSVNNYYLEGGFKLLSNPEIKKIYESTKKNINSKVLDPKESIQNGMVFNLDLPQLSDYILRNPELLNIHTNTLMEKVSQNIEDYKWAINYLIVNIDTYMNIYFKILFNVEKESQLPKGFYDNPIVHIYNKIPELKGHLSAEFRVFNELHSLRNNIVHNDLIVDSKLKSKLNLQTSINNDSVQIYLPDFDNVVNYIVCCLYIIYRCGKFMDPSVNIIEKLEDRNVSKLLQEYCNKKKKQQG